MAHTHLTGAPRQILTLLTSLDEPDFKPILCTPEGSIISLHLRRYNIECVDLPYPNPVNNPVRRQLGLPSTHQFHSLCRQYQPAALWVRGLKALLAVLSTAHKFSLPILWDIGVEKTYASYYRPLNTHMLRYVQATVTEGSSVSKQLFGLKSSEQDDILELVPPIAPERRSQMVSIHERRRNGAPQTSVLMVGSVHPRKNQEVAIKAMRIVTEVIPEAQLQIVGPTLDRKYEGRIRALAQSCGVGENTQILGWRGNIEPFLENAGALIITSKAEGLPHVVKEAMLAGVPVVSTSVGAIPDVIEHGVTGWLIEHADPKLLGEALCHLLTRPEVSDLIAERAHQKAMRIFDLETWIADYKRVLHSVTM